MALSGRTAPVMNIDEQNSASLGQITAPPLLNIHDAANVRRQQQQMTELQRSSSRVSASLSSSS